MTPEPVFDAIEILEFIQSFEKWAKSRGLNCNSFDNVYGHATTRWAWRGYLRAMGEATPSNNINNGGGE